MTRRSRKRRRRTDPAWRVLGYSYLALAVVLLAYFVLPLFRPAQNAVQTAAAAATATELADATATDLATATDTPDIVIPEVPQAAPDVITSDQLASKEPDRWGRVFSDRGVAYNAETLHRLPVLALTFDDGPHATLTDELIDILAEYDAHATFFALGEQIEMNPNTTHSLHEHGHLICSHGWDHEEALSDMDEESRTAMLDRTARVIYDFCGEYPPYVRPPYGSIDYDTAATVDYPLMLWTVDTLDWSVLDADTVCNTIVAQARDGEVILCHDIYESTIYGVAQALEQLMDQGWQFVTLEEYYSIFGIQPSPGEVYCGRELAVL